MSDETMRFKFATFEDWQAVPLAPPTCSGGAAKMVEYARHAFNAGRATSGAASGEVRPVWELYADGWDGVADLDGDWMQTLPIGTKLYYLGTAPAEQSAPPVSRMGGDTITTWKDRMPKKLSGDITTDSNFVIFAMQDEIADLRALLATQSASTAHGCPIQTPYGTALCFKCTEAELSSTAPGQADTERDAARYRWLADRFTGYDFYWGGRPDAETDEGKGKIVAVFELPSQFNGGRDISNAIDVAIAALPKENGQ